MGKQGSLAQATSQLLELHEVPSLCPGRLLGGSWLGLITSPFLPHHPWAPWHGKGKYGTIFF